MRNAAVLAAGALSGNALPLDAVGIGALRSSTAFLSAQQSPDGAWRSSRYGAFRDGDALTPLVLWVLSNAKATALQSASSCVRGLRWLEEFTAEQTGRAERWACLHYPLFTASYCAQIFACVGDMSRANFWADLVEQLRLNETLGWPVEDSACGAWSDSPMPPRRPPGVSSLPDMIAPNISATLIGLRALVAVGRAAAATKARPFLTQCQNFAPTISRTEFDDGGFFFAVGDPIRNKAGVAGRDSCGRERYRSYGSATCDGVLGLYATGSRRDDPRIRAGMMWLERHARGGRDGAEWPAARRTARDSLFYYHAQALAETLTLLCPGSRLEGWAAEQKRALINELLIRQESNGSWTGRCPHSFEDDSLVATAFAMRALVTAM